MQKSRSICISEMNLIWMIPWSPLATIDDWKISLCIYLHHFSSLTPRRRTPGVVLWLRCCSKQWCASVSVMCWLGVLWLSTQEWSSWAVWQSYFWLIKRLTLLKTEEQRQRRQSCSAQEARSFRRREAKQPHQSKSAFPCALWRANGVSLYWGLKKLASDVHGQWWHQVYLFKKKGACTRCLAPSFAFVAFGFSACLMGPLIFRAGFHLSLTFALHCCLLYLPSKEARPALCALCSLPGHLSQSNWVNKINHCRRQHLIKDINPH